MLPVHATTPAELAQLQAIRVVALVLDRRVITLLAFVALQRDDRGAALCSGHVSTPQHKRDLAALGRHAFYHRTGGGLETPCRAIATRLSARIVPPRGTHTCTRRSVRTTCSSTDAGPPSS